MGFHNGKEKTSSSERQFVRSHAGDKLRPTPQSQWSHQGSIHSHSFYKGHASTFNITFVSHTLWPKTMLPSWESTDSRTRCTTYIQIQMSGVPWPTVKGQIQTLLYLAFELLSHDSLPIPASLNIVHLTFAWSPISEKNSISRATFNPRTPGMGVGGRWVSVSLRPVWSTEQAPGLHSREFLSPLACLKKTFHQ